MINNNNKIIKITNSKTKKKFSKVNNKNNEIYQKFKNNRVLSDCMSIFLCFIYLQILKYLYTDILFSISMYIDK